MILFPLFLHDIAFLVFLAVIYNYIFSSCSKLFLFIQTGFRVHQQYVISWSVLMLSSLTLISHAVFHIVLVIEGDHWSTADAQWAELIGFIRYSNFLCLMVLPFLYYRGFILSVFSLQNTLQILNEMVLQSAFLEDFAERALFGHTSISNFPFYSWNLWKLVWSKSMVERFLFWESMLFCSADRFAIKTSLFALNFALGQGCVYGFSPARWSSLFKKSYQLIVAGIWGTFTFLNLVILSLFMSSFSVFNFHGWFSFPLFCN